MIDTDGNKKREVREGVRVCSFSIGIVLLAGVLLLLSCTNSRSPEKASHHSGIECPAYTAEGLEVSCLTLHETTYVVLHVDLRAARIKMLWKNPAGVPYSSLGEAYRQVGGGLLALTNAGIYAEDHTPEGLHIEEGRTLSPLNLNKGEGNFYMRPNGVFFVADDGAGIIESEKFSALSGKGRIREATQSGPLLVIDGEVNHNLAPDSRSLFVRNGIGVKSANEVYIVIAGDEVNFYDFASVFSEQLHCRNALYLDGCVSQVYLPARGSYIPEQRRCNKELAGLLAVAKLK